MLTHQLKKGIIDLYQNTIKGEISVSKKQTLRDMRTSKNMTVTEVASLSGISYPSLLNYESVKNIPNLIVGSKLLSLYEQSVDNLDMSPWENNQKSRKN